MLMNDVHQASVAGKPLHCPVCNHGAFHAKKFMLQYGFWQVFDLVPFREEGLMLMCEHCSYIQHFARHSLVELEPSG
jgi:hypothetical protein